MLISDDNNLHKLDFNCFKSFIKSNRYQLKTYTTILIYRSSLPNRLLLKYYWWQNIQLFIQNARISRCSLEKWNHFFHTDTHTRFAWNPNANHKNLRKITIFKFATAACWMINRNLSRCWSPPPYLQLFNYTLLFWWNECCLFFFCAVVYLSLKMGLRIATE